MSLMRPPGLALRDVVRTVWVSGAACAASQAACLLGPRALHPAVAQALSRPAGPARVAEIARDCGLSHRRFVDVYRAEVGLAPKAHARVRRLRRAAGCSPACRPPPLTQEPEHGP